MLNVYICEDNEQQRSQIEKVIKNIILIEEYDMKLVKSTSNPYEILEAVKESPEVGVYFLDIDLNTDMNGLMLAKKIRSYDPRCFIVFITSHSEMSYMTFMYKVEAMDFIIKDDIHNIKIRIHECMNKSLQLYSSVNNKIQKSITIKVADKFLTIALEEINFVETSSNYHKLILHSVNRLVEFNNTLKEFEEKLDERFVRCHRSFIVNKDNIENIDRKKRVIVMKNGDTCLYSTRLVKNLLVD